MTDPNQPTANISLGMVLRGISGAEVQMNDALLRLDSIINAGVEAFDQTSLPVSPVNGQSWKIGTGALPAEWTAKDDHIAIYYGTWLFVPISDGMLLYDKSGDDFYICTDAATDTWEIIGREAATVAALTNSSGGSADGTLSACADTTASDQSGVINDNFTELHTKIDTLLTNLKAADIIA